ncbi:hypothetical protein [Actinomadura luteofluorescens]|uniref:hypothetical protein n=1 Tax=Actinomadura luteofluorescens TaxID=46163 RepID=UPI003D89D059
MPYTGPCVLRYRHDGPVHQDANGVGWTDPQPGSEETPAALCPPALRERIVEALRKAAYVCPGDECPHSEDECGANEPILLAASTVIDGIPEAMLIDGEVTAIADAVLPVVEEALAEQAQTLRAVEIDRDQWRDRAHHWKAAAERVRTSLTAAERRAVADGDARATLAIREARAALEPKEAPHA